MDKESKKLFRALTDNQTHMVNVLEGFQTIMENQLTLINKLRADLDNLKEDPYDPRVSGS